jgi:hypothetical protein
MSVPKQAVIALFGNAATLAIYAGYKSKAAIYKWPELLQPKHKGIVNAAAKRFNEDNAEAIASGEKTSIVIPQEWQ